MASGKSMNGKEFALIRANGEYSLLTFEKLWEILVKRYPVKKIGEMEVIGDPDIEVLTLSGSGVKWARPRYIIRHRYKGKMYKIMTKTGRELLVTPDHSLLIWSVGDENDRFSIRIVPAKPEEILCKQTYLPYLRQLSLEVADAKGKIADPKFGYVLGFYVAEGYINGTTPQIHHSEGDILQHVLIYLSELGIKYEMTPEKRKPHMRYISLYDADLEQHIKSVGNKAREKRVPDIFWAMDEEWRAAFLAGLIDGDGSVHPAKYIIEITTASRELAYGLLYAFASIGVHAYIREKHIKKYPDRTYYRVFVPIGINADRLSKVMKYLSNEKKRLIEEAIERSSNPHSETDIVPAEVAYAIGTLLKRTEFGRDEDISFELRSYKYKKENPTFFRIEKLLSDRLYEIIPRGVGFDKVEKIEEVDYDDYVYDIEVPDTQNFEANGIFVHNTTLLQALISALPVSYKVITIEDTPELSTPTANWHPLYVRRAAKESELEDVTFSRLVIHSLRHRGTIVTLGEVRGEEMADLIQAAASVARDTPVLVRIDGEPRYTTIGEVVDELYGNVPDWTRVTPKRRIEVLTLTRDGKLEFRPVQWVLRHYHKGKLYRIWYRSKTNPAIIGFVDVTENHSIFVIRNGELVAERGDSVKVGDVVIMSDVRGVKSEGEVIRVEMRNYDGYVYDFSVPDTEAFFGGNFVFVLLHNSGHGAICLRPNARVVASIDGSVPRVYTIKEVYEAFRTGRRVEVLSYDLQSGKPISKKVVGAVEVVTDKWIRIRTKSGRILDATPDHRLPVVSGGKYIIKEAKNVSVGDALLVINAVPSESNVKRYIIFDEKYYEMNETLGALYALLFIGRHYSRRIALPIDVDAEVARLLQTIVHVKHSRRRIFVSESILRFLTVISEAIKSRPIGVPISFARGFYNTMKKYGVRYINFADQSLAYAVHYMLKLLGVDSVVSGSTLQILGEGPQYDEVISVEVIDDESYAYDIEVEDTHTFVVDSSIVSMNCTFHAQDPESVLARITSPPINAAPESLMLITSIAHIAYTKSLAGGRVTPVRRVMRIFEIKNIVGRKVESSQIFRWDPLTDRHMPNLTFGNRPEDLEHDATVLKQVWDNSRVIRILGMNTYGEAEAPRILTDIYALAAFLHNAATKKEIIDIKSLLLNLSSFYLRMDSISRTLYEQYFREYFKKLGLIQR